MKNKCWFSLFTGIGVLALSLSAASASTTNGVFQLLVQANGTAEEVGTNLTAKVKVTSAEFINLALGEALGTAVPSNQVLAVTVDSSFNAGDIIVYDTVASNVVATVATGAGAADIATTKSTQFMALMDIATIGSIESGEIMLSGTFMSTPKAPFIKLTATAASFLRIDLSGHTLDIVLPKGTVKLGAQVGQIIE